MRLIILTVLTIFVIQASYAQKLPKPFKLGGPAQKLDEAQGPAKLDPTQKKTPDYNRRLVLPETAIKKDGSHATGEAGIAHSKRMEAPATDSTPGSKITDGILQAKVNDLIDNPQAQQAAEKVVETLLTAEANSSSPCSKSAACRIIADSTLDDMKSATGKEVAEAKNLAEGFLDPKSPKKLSQDGVEGMGNLVEMAAGKNKRLEDQIRRSPEDLEAIKRICARNCAGRGLKKLFYRLFGIAACAA
ncbi:MAG: hypothetical protein HY537_08970 [Deltaproteobacteria bacterium]|nr:hypothetical protein [Deltaproteobacteria bacterium]